MYPSKTKSGAMNESGPHALHVPLELRGARALESLKGVFTQLRGVMEFILALNGPRQTRGGSNVHSLPNI